jgi:hypothetical protein
MMMQNALIIYTYDACNLETHNFMITFEIHNILDKLGHRKKNS